MKSLLGLLVMGCAMIVFGSYAWNQMRRVPLVAPAFPVKDSSEKSATFAESQEAQRAVTYAGPLANYVNKQEAKPGTAERGPQVETLETISSQPVASDHVGGSVVGSTTAILNKTFRVRGAVQLPFEVPAHAASPRLRGTYQAFAKTAGAQASDTDAQVEFLVLTEQQYADFMNRRAGEATFAAEDAHAQEVNTRLPPTLSQGAKYHLVFRNNSKDRERKFVQAEFHMEF